MYKLLHTELPVTNFGYLKANIQQMIVRWALQHQRRAGSIVRGGACLPKGAGASADSYLFLVMKEKAHFTQSIYLVLEFFMCER